MTVKNKTVAQEIADLLKQNAEEVPEGYTGTEWTEAVGLLSSLETPPILKIPWCISDLMLDERGMTKLESEYDATGNLKSLDEDGVEDPNWQAQPERRSRFDILAILAWIPMKRSDPDALLEDIGAMISADNVIKITRMVFTFWGVNVKAAEEQIAQLEEDAETEEAEDTGDFQE